MSQDSNFTKINAILSLVPKAEVVMRGEDIEWLNPSTPPVTDEQIEEELVRLENEYQRNAYQRKRAREYPPITDYLDGMVKGDQAQIDAYVAACQAVKDKYPKPEDI